MLEATLPADSQSSNTVRVISLNGEDLRGKASLVYGGSRHLLQTNLHNRIRHMILDEHMSCCWSVEWSSYKRYHQDMLQYSQPGARLNVYLAMMSSEDAKTIHVPRGSYVVQFHVAGTSVGISNVYFSFFENTVSAGVAKVIHTIELAWSPRQTQGSIGHRIGYEDTMQFQRSRLGQCAVCCKATHQKCSKCNAMRYCSKECQENDSPSHESFCQDISVALAADESARNVQKPSRV